MENCPTRQQLEQLLTEEHAGSVREQLLQHVWACARCQAELDVLTDDPELRLWLSGEGGPSTDDARDEEASLR